MGRKTQIAVATVAVVAGWRLASEIVIASRRAAQTRDDAVGPPRLQPPVRTVPSAVVKPAATDSAPAPSNSDTVDERAISRTAASSAAAGRAVRGASLRAVFVAVGALGALATAVAAARPADAGMALVLVGGVLTIVASLVGVRVVRNVRMPVLP